MGVEALPIACLAAALLAVVAPEAAVATPAPGNCEALREQIEAKIRAAGVASFTLTVVDAAAATPGKVVGSCDRGSRRIVYARPAGPASTPVPAPAAASAPTPTPAPARQPAPVLTECRDGSVRHGGDCPR